MPSFWLISSTIKKQIFSGFLIITMLIIAAFGISLYYLNKASTAREARQALANLHLKTLSLIHLQNHFIINELTDTTFYKTGSNKTLDDIAVQKQALGHDFKIMINEGNTLPNSLQASLAYLSELYTGIDSSFNELKYTIKERGFKNWGVIGKMRKVAHTLEDSTYLPQREILMLRRHEKDFLLRNDEQYALKFNRKCIEITKNIEDRNDENALIAKSKIAEYNSLFIELTRIQKSIGFQNKNGLHKNVANYEKELINYLDNLIQQASTLEMAETKKLKQGYFISIFCTICLSFFISYTTSERISSPISSLSKAIRKNILQQSTRKVSLEEGKLTVELQNLTDDFNLLLTDLEKQFKEVNEKSEDLRIRNNELDHFVYSTSHDLRAPISSALGLINIYKIEEDDAKKEYYLEMMEKCLHKLNHFIADVAHISKNARTSVDVARVDIHSIIEEILLEQQFVEGAQKLSKQVDVSEEYTLFSDQRRLKVIMNNLISNSIKYTNPLVDQQSLHIYCKIDRAHLEIEVSDNGMGIEEAHLPYVFDMFYRATESKSGSGLGLYIVKQTIDKLEGSIQVASIKGQGTTFRIKIPNITKSTQPVALAKA